MSTCKHIQREAKETCLVPDTLFAYFCAIILFVTGLSGLLVYVAQKLERQA
jgi:hypothetical protein